MIRNHMLSASLKMLLKSYPLPEELDLLLSLELPDRLFPFELPGIMRPYP